MYYLILFALYKTRTEPRMEDAGTNDELQPRGDGSSIASFTWYHIWVMVSTASSLSQRHPYDLGIALSSFYTSHTFPTLFMFLRCHFIREAAAQRKVSDQAQKKADFRYADARR